MDTSTTNMVDEGWTTVEKKAGAGGVVSDRGSGSWNKDLRRGAGTSAPVASNRENLLFSTPPPVKTHAIGRRPTGRRAPFSYPF
ncbi:hypothetical protein N9F40_00755 [bacterium]|nr:hypothetical protein [bacterium]